MVLIVKHYGDQLTKNHEFNCNCAKISKTYVIEVKDLFYKKEKYNKNNVQIIMFIEECKY